MFVLLRMVHKDTSYYKDIWVKKQALFMSFIVLQVEGDWCQSDVDCFASSQGTLVLSQKRLPGLLRWSLARTTGDVDCIRVVASRHGMIR